jgi:hypothetical protein
MSETNPPIEDVPVFNPIYWESTRPNINVAYLDANYLKFPNSQASAQTFTKGLFSDGQLIFTNTITSEKTISSLVNLTFDTAATSTITFSDGTTQTTAPLPFPVGTTHSFVGSFTLPSNFLETDGSFVSQTTYPDLFAAIGHTYGLDPGDGTFKLPTILNQYIIAKH